MGLALWSPEKVEEGPQCQGPQHLRNILEISKQHSDTHRCPRAGAMGDPHKTLQRHSCYVSETASKAHPPPIGG